MARICLEFSAEQARPWIQALSALRRMRSIPISTVGRIEGLENRPNDIICSGLEFLLSVGQACARPTVELHPSNLFAVLKYAELLSLSRWLSIRKNT